MTDPTKIEEITKDVDKYTSLDALASQEGGKILVDSLIQDIVNTIDALGGSYRKYTLEDFVSQCATLGANLSLLRVLTRSERNKKEAKAALEAALKE